MARIRSIKPEFFASLSIADLSVPARLHFIGLWTHVDDEARAEDEPRLLKAALWPLDDKMTTAAVDKLQEELALKGKITRYQVDGRKYFTVNGWDHQKIDRKRPSKLPPLCDASPSDRRGIVEGSLPDHGSRDLYLDQGSGSSSSGSDDASDRVVVGSEEEETKFEEVVGLVAKLRLDARMKSQRAGAVIANPDRWLSSARTDVRDTLTLAVKSMLASYPDAQPCAIAEAIQNVRDAPLRVYLPGEDRF